MPDAYPFDVSDEQMADLTDRLGRTRWPTPWPAHEAVAGVDDDELRRLVRRWATGFDWRNVEATLRQLPWSSADVDGARVGYLMLEAEGSQALPVVLTHGWPSTVLELLELGRRLATPSLYGGRPQDALTVVIPALPGFPGSDQRPEFPPRQTHHLWHRLMTEHLGWSRYGAHGGDLGAGVTTDLGHAYRDHVAGIHLLAVADPAEVDPESVTPDERAHLDRVAAWFDADGAYEHQQMTRPMTLAHGLSDSPVGLLAWILEKYRDWSDPRSASFDDDFILTQASLYWFTNAISTSFRPYWEYRHRVTPAIDRVNVPTAVAVFPCDLAQPPRSWCERTYDLQRYSLMDRGGHFAAHEQPDLLAEDIRDFFDSLR